MILTGTQICNEVYTNRILIEPFNEKCIEPNSYGFHLGDSLLLSRQETFDWREPVDMERITISDSGYILKPNILYLGHTFEQMGSEHYPSTLFATRSIATLGIWIQYSAELGHQGALIPWTLEMRVCHPVQIHRRMRIGKIAFWTTQGKPALYTGRYRTSTTVHSSIPDVSLGAEC